MENLFAPYELAKIAKEKGFDEKCFDAYSGSGKLTGDNTGFHQNSLMVSHFTSAPLYQQITDWLREQHKIEVTIMPVFREKCGYDAWKRDGYTYEIMRIEPCQILNWGDFNRCAEDRDEEKINYPDEPSTLSPSSPNYYEVWNKGIEHAFKLI